MARGAGNLTLAVFAGVTVLSLPACELAGPHRSVAPTIVSAVVGENSHNVLSAVVRFGARNADSACVVYRALSPDGRIDSSSARSTPFYAVRADSGRITALGMRPNTSYEVTLVVAGGDADTSAKMSFHSGALPQPLVGVELKGSGVPTSGYALTDFTSSTTAYIVAFDESGAVAWYREFPAQSGEGALDAEQQTNGDYVLFVGASTGWQPTAGRFYEVNPAGDSVQTFVAKAPYYTDPHELLLDFSGGNLLRSHVLGYEIRHVDLTSIGGKSDQQVAGHVLLRQSASGTIEFAWNAWDHFTIADWIFINPGLANLASIDFDHPNSIERDGSGNYIVSFASLGEITKIDGTTGAMLWRFGGRNNQFTFVGDPLSGFGIQHDVRLLPNGDLLLMDNGLRHNPQQSRAVEYRLDLTAHTATLVWEYRHSPPIFAPFAGSVQRLREGNTLVAFGAAARVAEVTANGAVVWEGDLTNYGQRVPYLYRARRLASLYRFEAR